MGWPAPEGSSSSCELQPRRVRAEGVATWPGRCVGADAVPCASATTRNPLQVERALPLGTVVTAVGELAAEIDHPRAFPVRGVQMPSRVKDV